MKKNQRRAAVFAVAAAAVCILGCGDPKVEEFRKGKVENTEVTTSETTETTEVVTAGTTNVSYVNGILFTYENLSNGTARLTGIQPTDDYVTTIEVPSELNGLPVSSIGPAFQGKNSIHSIILPTSVVDIQPRAFEGNPALMEIHGMTSVTSLGDRCLANNPALAAVDLPEKVSNVGKEVFDNTPGLIEIQKRIEAK